MDGGATPLDAWSVLHGLPDAVVVFDAAWHATWVSATATALARVPPERLRALLAGRDRIVRFARPAHREAIREAMAAAARGEQAVVEASWGRAPGRGVFQTAVAPHRGADGAVVGYRTSTREVTALAQGRDAAAAEAEWARFLLDAACDITLFAAGDGVVRWVSQAVTGLLGWHPDELVGQNGMAFLVHPLDRARAEAAHAASLRGERSRVRHRCRHRDGSWHWFEVVGSPALAHDPSRHGLVVTLRPIDDQVAAEATLARSEALHRTVVERIGEGLLLHDRDGRVVSVNAAAARLLGIDRGRILGRTPWDQPWPLVDDQGEALTLADDPVVATLRTGRAVEGRVIGVLHPTDGLRWVRATTAPLAGSELAGVLLVLTDVTHERAAAQELAESEARFRLLTEHATDLVLTLEPDATITYASPSLEQLLGYRPGDVVHTSVLDAIPTLDRADERWGVLLAELRSRGSATRRLPLPHADGRHRWFEAEVVGLRGDRGELVQLNVFARDIHERRRAERALARSEARFRLLADRAPMGIVTSGADGRWHYANEAGCELVGIAPADAPGWSWGRSIHPDDRDRVAREWQDQLAGGEEARLEFRVVAGTGAVRHVLHTVVRTSEPGEDDRFLATVVDLTERYELEQRLAHDATHDALTGLPNRVLLLDRLSHSLDREARTGGSTGVLFVDLDRFKPVNDRHGHAVGDEVLAAVAARITTAVRQGDTAARLGGDEFVVVLDGPVSVAEAEAVAHRVVDALRRPFPTSVGEVQIGASAGVAMARPGDRPDALLASADDAVYRAKAGGRGGVALAR